MSEAIIISEMEKPCLGVLDLNRRSGRHVTPVRLMLVGRDCWRAEYAAPGGAGVIVMMIGGRLDQVKTAIGRTVDGSRNVQRGRWISGAKA